MMKQCGTGKGLCQGLGSEFTMDLTGCEATAPRCKDYTMTMLIVTAGPEFEACLGYRINFETHYNRKSLRVSRKA